MSNKKKIIFLNSGEGKNGGIVIRYKIEQENGKVLYMVENEGIPTVSRDEFLSYTLYQENLLVNS